MDQNNSFEHTFDEVALLYNEARPRCPDELFSTLVNVAHLQNGSKLLEIGAGTGQATKPLADRGFDINAVELGTALTKVAKHELRDHKNVQIITGAFEKIMLPVNSSDLIFAATSFRWIYPSLRYLQPNQLLKDYRHLAIIHTNHISDKKGDCFFNATQSTTSCHTLENNDFESKIVLYQKTLARIVFELAEKLV
jgi:trans-aconitate methyltransferase